MVNRSSFRKVDALPYNKAYVLLLITLGIFLLAQNRPTTVLSYYAGCFSTTSSAARENDADTDGVIFFRDCILRANKLNLGDVTVSRLIQNISWTAIPQQSTIWRDVSEIVSLPQRQNNSSQLLANLKCSKVIVSVCCRNLLGYLPKFRRNINLIVSVFHSYQIIFGESDSADGTLDYLKNWSRSDPNVIVHTFGNLMNRPIFNASRSSRISYCRNFILNDARKQNRLEQAMFYLVADPDVNGNDILTLDSFLSNFEYDWDAWAVMTAAQRYSYYDIWALRSKWVPYDCWRMASLHRELNMTPNAAVYKFVWRHTQPPIPRDHGLVEVYSAFGGFAIYQTKYLKNCVYSGREEGSDVCEHVSLHRCIKINHGRLFINPSFQNGAGPARRR